jgi:hypothetical protein
VQQPEREYEVTGKNAMSVDLGVNTYRRPGHHFILGDVDLGASILEATTGSDGKVQPRQDLVILLALDELLRFLILVLGVTKVLG